MFVPSKSNCFHFKFKDYHFNNFWAINLGPDPEDDLRELAQPKTDREGGDGPDLTQELVSKLETVHMPEAGMLRNKTPIYAFTTSLTMNSRAFEFQGSILCFGKNLPRISLLNLFTVHLLKCFIRLLTLREFSDYFQEPVRHGENVFIGIT